jgi:pimeloyl-ACP methyl ester carboxylesterase
MNLLLRVVGAVAAVTQPIETQLEAPGPKGPLRGTLLAAAEEAPIVLIIPGSGPTDRDGNNPLGIRAASYRLLAEGLASRGIGSVRIDKRGMFGSKDAVADANAVTIADYARDVGSWVTAARQRTGARCIWLLGHSEGGLVALAARERSDVCGLVLVASPGRRAGEILREQLRANPANAPILDQALAAVDRLEAGQRVDTAGLSPALMPLFAPQVQGFVINLFSLDPAGMLRGYRRPVLILQGQRDLQVSEADARRLAAANSKAKLVLLPAVNHVLKQVASDDRAANAATYADPNRPLGPGIVDAIASFIGSARPKR